MRPGSGTLAALATAAVLGCSSGSPPVAAPAPPDLTPFVFAAEPTQYRVASLRTYLTEALGQATTLNSRLRFATQVTVGGTGSERDITVLIDSVITSEGQMFLAGSRSQAAGTTVRGHLSHLGQLTDLTLDPIRLAQDPIVGQISTFFQQYFPRVPAGGVIPGAEWSDTTTVTRAQNGTDIVVEAITEFRAGYWSDTTRTAELEVEWTREYVVSGTGEQMGQAFTVAGAGRSEGQHRLRGDGVYLGSIVRDSSSSEINITSLGQVVPLIQTGIDSVTIFP